MLTPEEGLQDCDWMEGFLSRRMLGRNRPYYELLAGGHLDDLTDGNRRIAEGARRL
jgi:muramidase (phage lysozyme)